MSESPNPSWASWAFPPFSDLINSTDCNVTTNYIADSVLLVTNGDYLTNSKLGDIGFLLEWLATLIPDGYGGLPANPDGGLAYAEYLMLWYFAVWQNTTYLGDLNATESMAYLGTWNHAHEFGYNCPSEKTRKEMICDKLDIQGDPDVSGRGMMIAYYILIGLTIIYFLTLIVGRTRLPTMKPIQKLHESNHIKRYGHRAMTALRQTVSAFLVASLVFATAMLGATVARYYACQAHQNDIDADDISFYTWLGLSAAVWALSLPKIDHFFVLTKAYGRYDAWDSSNSTEAFEDFDKDDYNLLFKNGTVYQPGIYRAMIWERHCDTSNLKERLRTLITVGICMQVPGFLYCLLTSLAAIISHSTLPPFAWLGGHVGRLPDVIRHINRIARPIIGFIYLGMAAVLLVSFIQYRNVAKQLAPSTDTDTDWSFGQILALAQWAPVGLEFLTEWRKERAKAPSPDQNMGGGLEGGNRSSSTYELVRGPNAYDPGRGIWQQ
ncbi:hypothetical protein G7054_g3150 [Neopestalotiopsis clavispora]|nr:hypothetical protein G7054_g3150 [Neopestalotiopsis clavispora]